MLERAGSTHGDERLRVGDGDLPVAYGDFRPVFSSFGRTGGERAFERGGPVVLENAEPKAALGDARFVDEDERQVVRGSRRPRRAARPPRSAP